jgi:uncharacterized membrane protein
MTAIDNSGQATTTGIRLPVTVRTVSVDRSGKWLAAGWRDMWRIPGFSLTYGVAFVLISYILTFGLINAGLEWLILPLFGGFMLVAPLLVVGLYDASRRLEAGEPVSLGVMCTAFRSHVTEIASMGLVLMLFTFAWIVVAIIIFALFYGQTPPPLHRFAEEILFSQKGAIFLMTGSAAGALFAATIFTVTAVSIPMLLDRDVDVITAIVVSIVAVRTNWKVMMGWAAMIGVVSFAGLVTFFIGLALALPLLGYATWHAYRDIIGPPA